MEYAERTWRQKNYAFGSIEPTIANYYDIIRSKDGMSPFVFTTIRIHSHNRLGVFVFIPEPIYI